MKIIINIFYLQTLQKIAPYYESKHFQNAMQQTGTQEPNSIIPRMYASTYLPLILFQKHTNQNNHPYNVCL